MDYDEAGLVIGLGERGCTYEGPVASAGVNGLDYEGGGRNHLLSSQRCFVGDPDRIEVTIYSYGQETHVDRDDMIGRLKQVWRRGSGGAWFEQQNAVTSYSYRKGQLEKVNTSANDFCPSVPECGSCDEPCATVDHTAYAEFYAYDIFGRRVASSHCDDAETPPTSEFYSCKWQTTMYDYEGLSQNVLAVRKSPVLGIATLTPDRYASTFTYGALGIVTRTEEFGNADPTDNVDHYYLSDAMGGYVAMLIDHDGDAMTPRLLDSQVFDAFGNRQTGSINAGAEYAWRGAEGSETESAPNLVLMQARHYDPELGRFLQADALPIASTTTQGMNRHIYCENDPVNFSDSSGLISVWQGIQFAAVGLALVGGLALLSNPATFLAGIALNFLGLGRLFDLLGDLSQDGCRALRFHSLAALFYGIAIAASLQMLPAAMAGLGAAEVGAFVGSIAAAVGGVAGGVYSAAGAVNDIYNDLARLGY